MKISLSDRNKMRKWDQKDLSSINLLICMENFKSIIEKGDFREKVSKVLEKKDKAC